MFCSVRIQSSLSLQPGLSPSFSFSGIITVFGDAFLYLDPISQAAHFQPTSFKVWAYVYISQIVLSLASPEGQHLEFRTWESSFSSYKMHIQYKRVDPSTSGLSGK